MNILIITSYFPPENHIASNRTGAMAKYLSNSNKIFVLTDQEIHPPAIPNVTVINFSSDHFLNLLKFKNDNIMIHKIKAAYNKILSSVYYDTRPGFYFEGLSKARNILLNEKVDIIISSSAPNSTHLVAMELKKEFPEKFLICDLRDELINRDTNFIKKFFLNKLERKIANNANLITTVSKPIMNDFLIRQPRAKQLSELRNGFDYDPIISNKPKSDFFEIIYTGTVYNQSSPENFFSALERLDKINLEKIKVTFYTGIRNFKVPSKLEGNIQVENKVSYDQMPKILEKADAFLLICKTSERKGVFTGKLFDYLAVNRPIIALVDPKDVAAQLINETNSGFFCDDRSIDEIEAIIKKLLTLWEQGKTLERNWNVVLKHHRRNEISEFENFFKKCYQN